MSCINIIYLLTSRATSPKKKRVNPARRPRINRKGALPSQLCADLRAFAGPRPKPTRLGVVRLYANKRLHLDEVSVCLCVCALSRDTNAHTTTVETRENWKMNICWQMKQGFHGNQRGKKLFPRERERVETGEKKEQKQIRTNVVAMRPLIIEQLQTKLERHGGDVWESAH